MPAPPGQITALAILAVRLLGLVFVVAGLWLLAANVLESAGEFDPSFAGYYLQSQALRPGLAVLAGVALWAVARPLARLLARGLDDSGK